MTQIGRIAIIGAGKLGGALLAGLVGTGIVERPQIVCTAATQRRCSVVRTEYRVSAHRDNRRAAAWADIIVLAVKPALLPNVMEEIADSLQKDNILLSMLTGVTTGRIEALLPQRVPVLRAVTNLPATVGEGVSVIAAGANAADAHLQVVEDLLTAIGHVERLPEPLLDVLTATSGSGPAYICLFLEALVDAAVGLEVPRSVATRMMVRTLLGTASLLAESGQDPVSLREAVTSPGGSTAAGLHILELAGVRDILVAAVEANHRRAIELGRA